MKDAAAAAAGQEEETGMEREVEAIQRSLLCLIGNLLIFDPRAALGVLEANGWTSTVFTVLFTMLPGFTDDGEPDGTERRRTILVNYSLSLLAATLNLGVTGGFGVGVDVGSGTTSKHAGNVSQDDRSCRMAQDDH